MLDKEHEEWLENRNARKASAKKEYEKATRAAHAVVEYEKSRA